MAKINHEEYDVLKALDDRAKYIVRQYGGCLWAAEQPIMKDNLGWYVEDGFNVVLKDDRLFQFIQWEDREPYNIAELIEEYEDSKEYKDSLVIEYFMDKAKESEETEVKNIEWLKEEIWKQDTVMDKGYIYTDDLMSIINEVDESEVKQLERKIEELESYNDELIRDNNQFINELDNQEVLSQEWISKHSNGPSRSQYVWVDDLKNLLVPKQDEVDRAYKDGYEKGREHGFYKGYREGLGYKGGEPETVAVVIPKFVAEWIEELKQDERPLYSVMSSLMNKTNHEWAVWKSANKNFSEIFAQAWIDDYEVAEEQKYYVLDNEEIPMLVKSYGTVNRANTHLSIHEKGRNTQHYQLTEQEIKDYDERYLAFKVPVEELEE